MPDPSHAQHATTQIDIAGMQPGTAPPGFDFTLTGGGPVSAWKVVADPTATAQKAIAQTSTDRTDYRFPLAVYFADMPAIEGVATPHTTPKHLSLVRSIARCPSNF